MHLQDFRLERFLAQYEFSAPHLLCTSDCESVHLADLLLMEDGAEERFKDLWLGYTESAGGPEVRREVAGIYSAIAPDDVLVTAGAEESIFLCMHAMLGPGDHVVVQSPAYQSLHEVARSIGCRVSHWTLRDEDGWRPDIEALKDLVTRETEAVVINTPHNPTGCHMTHEEFRAVRDIAEDAGAWVFSDEVYRFLEYDPADRLPPMADIYEKGVSVGVMSKAFGLAGLRIGWTATRDAELRRRVAALKDYTTICCSAPSEFLTALALRHTEEIVGRNLGIIRSNLALLDAFFARHADRFAWVRPTAGAIGFPRLLTDESAEAFAIRTVQESGVLLLPSTAYEYGDSHFRVGFARTDLPAALRAFEDYLDGRTA
ncbi:aminotransferase class I/II-fold pyridoxal phosphate-dependent enzyme [Methanofollis formosanus]|uniref:Aminotransferase class I/II-fold pyridoxal phosphate-dependent enzyme n=2 Tax=Methanofollis formosanus TaxID=299308 RepID=A0A8G1A3P9_9EURY|nr:aminotransferase class I/II-fold pyridoxal phosphate-dependent enzyme [Methanofollis formosanus]